MSETTFRLLLIATLCAVFAALIFSVQYPPLLDYPNHLARVHVLLNLDQPFFAERFGLSFQIRPNLAFDLFVALFAQFFSIETAGRLFFCLTIVVTVLAPILLSWTPWGRITVVSMLGTLIAFNTAVLFGFLGYVFSASLAVCFFAAYVFCLSRSQIAAWIVGIGFPLLLFVFHVGGFLVYSICIGGYFLSARGPGYFGRLIRHAIPFLPTFAVILVYLSSFKRDGSEIEFDFLEIVFAGLNPLNIAGKFVTRFLNMDYFS